MKKSDKKRVDNQHASVTESKRYMALYGHTLISEAKEGENVVLNYRSAKRPDVVFRMIHDRRGRLETEYV